MEWDRRALRSGFLFLLASLFKDSFLYLESLCDFLFLLLIVVWGIKKWYLVFQELVCRHSGFFPWWQCALPWLFCFHSPPSGLQISVVFLCRIPFLKEILRKANSPFQGCNRIMRLLLSLWFGKFLSNVWQVCFSSWRCIMDLFEIAGWEKSSSLSTRNERNERMPFIEWARC